MNSHPSSRMLAFAATGVIIVVCGAVVATLLLVRDSPSPEADSVAPSYPFGVETETYTEPEDYPETETYSEPETQTTEEFPTTETTVSTPDGFVQVTGPGGMTTYIPSGWPTKTASGPGAMQADDPTGAAVVLRYGGSPTPELDIYQVHADYEQQFAANRSGYELIHLDSSTVREWSAVDWEFEYDPDGDVRRHVRSYYWLAGGIDYFVYASAPVDQWSYAEEILDVMLENATP